MSHNTYKLSHKSKWKIQEKIFLLIWTQNLTYLKKRSKALNSFFSKGFKETEKTVENVPFG